MLIAGSYDGAYGIDDVSRSENSPVRKVLDAGAVMRVRRFDGVDGAFAASRSGLYHSTDGEEWTDLGVPEEQVYSIGSDAAGDRLYAGTKPAAVYVAELPAGTGSLDPAALEWRERDGFQELPSRDEWRLPRHENLAQVRDLHADPGGRDRLVAGVEVGGVHVSEDGGETWEERREGVHDDVHELRVVDDGEYVAATGYGLFRTSDAGRTWTRLDGGVTQRYFRSAVAADGVVYAGGAMANSSTWGDADADPQLIAVRAGDSPEPVAIPAADETVTGMTTVDGDLVVATHRGSVFVRRSAGWDRLGELPVPADEKANYAPLCRFEP